MNHTLALMLFASICAVLGLALVILSDANFRQRRRIELLEGRVYALTKTYDGPMARTEECVPPGIVPVSTPTPETDRCPADVFIDEQIHAANGDVGEAMYWIFDAMTKPHGDLVRDRLLGNRDAQFTRTAFKNLFRVFAARLPAEKGTGA